jgi:single-stranded DNA-binding protein
MNVPTDLAKNSMVAVEGRLHTREWDDEAGNGSLVTLRQPK